jgi:3-hydroxybutyrate dehydrogenase
MAVNLDGTFHCIREALPAMTESGWGRIVNVVSTAGLVGYRYVSAYCAAKHGVVGLTRALALETATIGVTVNAVCPGYTDTDMTTRTIQNIVARTGAAPDEVLATLTAQNPQKRLLTPDEVAHTIVWLCTPGSESITGQTIAIAGGEVT